MSRIDRLSILGIRSFDNTRIEVIQFYTPLTLIVGTNGSGKTTIIECLKFATTGELPPNSKGGAFIHDPKLCGENEVMAQVRLQFVSNTQEKRVATRNLQLTVKKTARSQKTLEGNIVAVNHGERVSLSSRVADMNRLIPHYLGVSKAILEAVVFCHQDESLWPMSEPLTLKKKFDEIFEAQKYTKAVDNLKGLRKKQQEALAQFKLSEQHAKDDKVKAEKIEQEGIELGKEIEALREEHSQYRDRASEADKKAREAWNYVAKYTEIVESLKAARKNRERYLSDIESLRQYLKELPDSEDQLRYQLEQFQDRMDASKKRAEEQGKLYKVIEGNIADARERQSERGVEAGKLQQKQSMHEQKLKDREVEIKKAAREHNIRGFDTDLDDMQISDFMERITRLRNDQSNKVDRLRRDNAAELQTVQEALDKLRERRSVLQESKRSAKEILTTNEKRVNVLYSDLDKISGDEAAKTSAETTIQDLESKLRNTTQQATTAALSSKIKTAREQQQSFEAKSKSLNAELLQRTKQAGELAKLDHLKKELDNRRRNVETMRGAHAERLERLLGHSWDPQTLEPDYQRVIETKKSNVKEAEHKRDVVNTELQQLDFKLTAARSEQKQKQKEVEDCAKFVRDKTGGEPEDFPENLLFSQTNRDTKKLDVEGFKNMSNYFREAIKTANSHDPACRLCQRPFENIEMARRFVSRLESKISKETLTAWEKDLIELESELDDAKVASSRYDTWERLNSKDLPQLKEAIAKLERDRETTVIQGEEHDHIVSGLEDAKRDVETLAKQVTAIVQCSTDIRNFEVSIKDLISKQSGSGPTSSIEELEHDIEAVGEKADEQRKLIEKLKADADGTKDLMASLNMDLINARNNLTTVQHELDKRASITSEISELKETGETQRETMRNLDAQLQDIGPQFSREELKLQDVKEMGELKQRELQSQASALADTVRLLQSINSEIKLYIDEGGPAELGKCQREIQAWKEKVSRLGEELKLVTIEVNKAKDEVINQDKHQRNLIDNITFRERKRELNKTEAEIQKLSTHNAEADQSRYRHDAAKWQHEYEKCNMEAASKSEVMKVKDDQLQKFEKSWNEYYKDAASNYRKSHIEVETTKAAIEDLGKYALALDKAIMKFHSMKMDEVNRIIDELWRFTYQGTDIDTILIRCDNETEKGNRSYKYRVCMIKQDTEMDMRGRCSAGQKVLASIIIRLALADSFGVQCGLIALDEPTTNLDRDNIRALAQSLHRLIQERQRQSNFQLIVITHDEDFLKEMKCNDFVDNYFRVSRNQQQKSQIEKQKIIDM